MNVYLLSLNKVANIADQWDYGYLKDFFDGNVWKTPNHPGFETHEVSKLPKCDRAIVVIPARHHTGLELEVNKELQNIKHVVLFLMGDEEADYDVSLIEHNSIHTWVQNPHPGVHDDFNKLGTGYPQHARKILSAIIPPIIKNKDIFFAGQVTHQRREELAEAMGTMKHGRYDVVKLETDGFTKGMPPLDYYMELIGARIAPAPSGAVIPDSFRFFEALECMAIPIADNKIPNGDILAYWDWLFGEICPFNTVSNWHNLMDITYNILSDYPHNLHKITAWWIAYKRKFAYEVIGQLYE